jgi:ankyrin repeat protein
VGAFIFLLSVVSLAVAGADDLRLVNAAKDQDVAAVRALLKQGAPVNISQPDGVTALHWAALGNNLQIADLLIGSGAQVNAADNYGVTPLSLACTNRNALLVENLLKAGANANAAQASGETVLMTCAYAGALDAVNALLASGANANEKESSQGHTALMFAAAQGHTELVRALIQHGADVHARSAAGYTALLLAAREAHLETTQALLAAGADVNEAAKDGTTALFVATMRGHTKYGEFLLDKGANPNLGPGFLPLHWAAATYDTELTDNSNGILSEDTEWSALGGLREPEKLEFVKALLAHGADPNAQARKFGARTELGVYIKGSMEGLDGATPFLLAARGNDTAVMRELIAHGADPKLTTKNGTTALMAAAGVNHTPGITRSIESEALQAVKLCLELGNDVNAANVDGETALHGAARRERADSIVQFLVDHGAKMNAKNKMGWTPLFIAEGIDTTGFHVKSDTTAALLRKLGATPSPEGMSREMPDLKDRDTDGTEASALGRSASGR